MKLSPAQIAQIGAVAAQKTASLQNTLVMGLAMINDHNATPGAAPVDIAPLIKALDTVSVMTTAVNAHIGNATKPLPMRPAPPVPPPAVPPKK